MIASASALSTHPVASNATGDVIGDLLEHQLGPPEIIIVFIAPAFAGAVTDIITTISVALEVAIVVAASSNGLLAAGTEVRGRPALAVWALWADEPRLDIAIHPIDDGLTALDITSRSVIADSDLAIVLGAQVLAGITTSVESICAVRGSKPTIGALLSVADGSMGIHDIDGGRHEAAVISINGIGVAVELDHSRRAVGGSHIITRSIGSMILELDGRPALDVVMENLLAADADSQHWSPEDLGLETTGDDGGTTDTVAVLGGDRSTRAVAVASPLDEGTRVHLTIEDVTVEPFGARSPSLSGPCAGALLFCSRPVDLRVIEDGVAEIGSVVERLGTSAFAGIHAAAVIGPGRKGSGITTAPFASVHVGRDHH